MCIRGLPKRRITSLLPGLVDVSMRLPAFGPRVHSQHGRAKGSRNQLQGKRLRRSEDVCEGVAEKVAVWILSVQLVHRLQPTSRVMPLLAATFLSC